METFSARCPRCGETKSSSDFNTNKRATNGLQTYCRPCHRELSRANYRQNKQYYKDGAKKRIRETKDRLRDLKRHPCADCGGVFDPICMDFDHRPGEDKVLNVAGMMRRHASWASIEEEMAKCDLVCANCHRIRTRDRADSIRNEKEAA